MRLNGPANNINAFIRKNWCTPTEKIECIGMTIKEWKLEHDISIVHTRQVRGDLIEVFLGKKIIVAFVDQSHAYGGMIGIGEVTVTASKEELELLYNLIK